MARPMALGYCEECGTELHEMRQAQRGYCNADWANVCARWQSGPDYRAVPEYAHRIGSMKPRGMDVCVLILRDGRPPLISCVPWTVVHHSPDGWSWGFSGSGPADFALNILNWYVPPGSDDFGAVPCFRGSASYTAWRLHQFLKTDMVARLPRAEDVLIREAVLRPWLTAMIAEKVRAPGGRIV